MTVLSWLIKTQVIIIFNIIVDHSRGFGFVTMRDYSNVEVVLTNQPHFIEGKQVDCKIAIPKEHIGVVNNVNNVNTNQCGLRKIFVGGLHPLVNESLFRSYFKQFGQIEECKIMLDKPSGKSRGRYIF